MKIFRIEHVACIVLAFIELIAGYIIHVNAKILTTYPVIMILIPALMDLRGNIYGVIGFRITTLLHTGIAKPSLRDREVMQNIELGLIITILASIVIALLAYSLQLIISLTFKSLKMLSFSFLIVLSLISSLIAYPIVMLIGLSIVLKSFKAGYLPEYITSPVITGIADVVTPITIFLTYLIIYQFVKEELNISFTCSLLVASVLVYVFARRRLIFRLIKVVKESLPTSLMCSCISGFGGFSYSLTIKRIVEEKLLIVTPPLNAIIGAIVGILASQTSISLHLSGKVENFTRQILSLIPILTLSILIPTLLTSISLIPKVLTTSIIVYLVLGFITKYLSIVLYSRGIDPDDVIFPFITSIVDFLTPTLLVVMVLVLT